MKRRIETISFSLVTIALGIWMMGCASVGKTIASAALSEDAAMKGWARWVVQGHGTPEQVTAVRAAHEKYIIAKKIARGAYIDGVNDQDKALWDQLLSQMVNRSDDVVKLVNQFQNQKSP
jgi:hypothetical protein